MEWPVLKAENEIDYPFEYRYNCFMKNGELTGLYLHRHDYFELIYLEKAPQSHFIEGKTVHIPQGSLLFIRPNDLHALYNPKKQDAVLHHLAFTERVANSLFTFLSTDLIWLIQAEFPPCVMLNNEEALQIQSLFKELGALSEQEEFIRFVTVRRILVQIFSQYLLHATTPAKQTPPQWLIETRRLMNYTENFSLGLERMVQLSGRSKEHLCRSMRKYYGISASEFINDLRLTYIANQLVNSNVHILDICYNSGFSNLSWMYSLFKKKYGCSPAAFRKNSLMSNAHL